MASFRFVAVLRAGMQLRLHARRASGPARGVTPGGRAPVPTAIARGDEISSRVRDWNRRGTRSEESGTPREIRRRSGILTPGRASFLRSLLHAPADTREVPDANIAW